MTDRQVSLPVVPKHQHEVLAFLGPESVTGQGPGIYVLIQDLGTYSNQWATVQQVGGQGAGGDIQSVERWGWLVGRGGAAGCFLP